MTPLLDQLGRETLPKPVVDEFMQWCLWDQARPALVLILEKTTSSEMAHRFQEAQTLEELIDLCQEANAMLKPMLGKTGPMGLSAAEAATFEFIAMARASQDEIPDAEALAFFAARVFGWAGWAATDFSDPSQKQVAEAAAREAQEKRLQVLLYP